MQNLGEKLKVVAGITRISECRNGRLLHNVPDPLSLITLQEEQQKISANYQVKLITELMKLRKVGSIHLFVSLHQMTAKSGNKECTR